jgi:hypothetical protein
VKVCEEGGREEGRTSLNGSRGAQNDCREAESDGEKTEAHGVVGEMQRMGWKVRWMWEEEKGRREVCLFSVLRELRFVELTAATTTDEAQTSVQQAQP